MKCSSKTPDTIFAQDIYTWTLLTTVGSANNDTAFTTYEVETNNSFKKIELG